MAESKLNFGLFGGGGDNLQTSDYRSAGSNQIEELKSQLVTDADVWVEIKVVPEDKTYYVSGVLMSLDSASYFAMRIGIGASAAEVAVFTAFISRPTPLFVAFPTPMKFAGGTRITVRLDVSNENGYVSLLGWEE